MQERRRRRFVYEDPVNGDRAGPLCPLRHTGHVNVYLPIDELLISVRRELQLANSNEKSKKPFDVMVQ